MFPIMRLLLPQLDTSRASYGLKEKLIARIYIKVLNIAPGSTDALALLSYQVPAHSDKSVAGNFPNVLVTVLEKRARVRASTGITIKAIHDKLDELVPLNGRSSRRGGGLRRGRDGRHHPDAEVDGLAQSDETDDHEDSGSSDDDEESGRRKLRKITPASAHAYDAASFADPVLAERVAIFEFFVANLTAEEQPGLCGSFSKMLTLGVHETKILPLFHPDAYARYLVCMDLKAVVSDLRDPQTRITKHEPVVFTPFLPMLFGIETKYDGERSLVHMKDGKFMYWSRRGKNHTVDFGASAQTGRFTPHIIGCINNSVKSLILDGEMMVFDQLKKCFVPFVKLSSNSHFEPRFGGQGRYKAFDPMLKRNPCYVKRYEILRQIITPKPGWMQISEHNPESAYCHNARSNSWLKIKADYVDGLADDIDVVMLGASYGDGRERKDTAGNLASFLCCIRGRPGRRQTLRTGTCRSALWAAGHARDACHSVAARQGPLDAVQRKSVPVMARPSKRRQRPARYDYQPALARVAQVRGAQIVLSDAFAAGFTLRARDAMTLSQFNAYMQRNGGRMQARPWEAGSTDGQGADAKLMHSQHRTLCTMATCLRVAIRRMALIQVRADICPRLMASNRQRRRRGGGMDRSGAVSKPNVRSSLTGSVLISSPVATAADLPLSGQVMQTADVTKHSLEAAISGHGGVCVQNALSSTGMIVSDYIDARVKNLINSNRYDVPKYLLHSTPLTAKRMQENVDRFGDSYFEDLTDTSLRELLDLMPYTPPDLEAHHLKRRRTMQEIHERYMPYVDAQICPGLLFSRTVAARVHRAYMSDSSQLDPRHITVVDDRLNADARARVSRILLAARQMHLRRFHIVLDSWVKSSIDHRFIADENEHSA
ncbi:hypothetical protein BC831DRAFT_494611 [Entophlyctis helioformis]|nr:hypothetical protein BC831DRAFT_494611 [Entophlyctis helioformis]